MLTSNNSHEYGNNPTFNYRLMNKEVVIYEYKVILCSYKKG